MSAAAAIEVQLISASWCKRCAVIKPEVEALCKTAGAKFTVVDFDELEEDDPVKCAVTALPTILMNGKTYTPAELDAWREAIAAAAVAGAVGVGDDDF
jgi:thiol-disulfide isomerase/thioredoxin